jgi:hypothetical protein
MRRITYAFTAAAQEAEKKLEDSALRWQSFAAARSRRKSINKSCSIKKFSKSQYFQIEDFLALAPACVDKRPPT